MTTKKLRSTPELLLRIAQADAYALAAEYDSQIWNSEGWQDLLDLVRYQPHSRYHKLAPGSYTDDTQMSIAVAEFVADDDMAQHDWHDEQLVKSRFAQRFYDAFKRDPRDGYARGFQLILEQSTSWQDMVSKIKPVSDRNGAAMRACPIGVLPDIENVLRLAEIQAKVTHDTWGGIRSAQAVALMAHYALWEPGELSALPEYVVNHLPDMDFLRQPWSGPVGHTNIGIQTAHACCTLVSTKGSLRDIMRQVIEWGGDTDSVAAVAWGCACPRMRDDKLPDFLEADLEKGTSGEYGAPFLRDLGQRLMAEFGG